MINTIAFLNNNNSEVTAYNVTDLRTGEILSTKIGVPRDLAVSVRRNGVYQMAEIDPRFRTYYIADEVICENLTARMLKAFGLSLGLATNLAGSAAYSPEELRSPEFTQNMVSQLQSWTTYYTIIWHSPVIKKRSGIDCRQTGCM